MQNICFPASKMSLQLEKIQDFPRMVKAKAPSRSAGGGPEPSGSAGWLRFFCAGEGGLRLVLGLPARTKKEPEQKTFCSGGPPPARRSAHQDRLRYSCGEHPVCFRNVSAKTLLLRKPACRATSCTVMPVCFSSHFAILMRFCSRS